MKKGQASMESMLILAVVLVAASTLYVTSSDYYMKPYTRTEARRGVKNSLTELNLKYGTQSHIQNSIVDNDKIIYELTVFGNPPPENSIIENIVENFAQNYLDSVQGLEYNVEIRVEKRVVS